MTGPVAVTHHDHTLPSTVSSLLLRDSVHTATVNAARAQFTLFWSTAALLAMASSSSHDLPPGPSPEERAGWFSRLTFMYVNPLLRIGLQRPLMHDDL